MKSLQLIQWLGASIYHIDGLVQDYIISSALTMEILQFCTNEWMNEYLFHRSFQIITSFHMHQYIELDFPYIWFTQVI